MFILATRATAERCAPGGSERLEHCRLALERGAAEGLLIYGKRTAGAPPKDHGTGSERERREKPADEADYAGPVGLVEVERHASRHHVAIHGISIAGDLTALAL